MDVFDPHADADDVLREYGIKLVPEIGDGYAAIILAVNHDEFLSVDFETLKKDGDSVIFDTKACLNRNIIDGRL